MGTDSADFHEPQQQNSAQWTKQPERGSLTLLRAMTFVSLRLGRPVGRVILYFIALYFLFFAPKARVQSLAYLRRVLGREPTLRDRFRQVFYFAANILDRLYLVNERFELFEVTLEGDELMRDLLRTRSGVLLMGSHLGSFEILSAIGRQQPGLKVAMAMYETNAHKVSSMLRVVNPRTQVEIIPLGHLDAMLKVNEELDQGTFVGLLADRSISDQPAHRIEFLGSPALFPLASMRLAAILRRPVVFMAGLYRGGNRYHVVFQPLADFSRMRRGERDAAVREALEKYAALLEKYCRSDPYNWFNFFDFWAGHADSDGVQEKGSSRGTA